jgi:hypothetical protein
MFLPIFVPLALAAVDKLTERLKNARSRGLLAPQDWASAYLPTRPFLEAALPASPTERATSITAYLAEIRPRWTVLRSNSRLYDPLKGNWAGYEWGGRPPQGFDERGATVKDFRLAIKLKVAGVEVRELLEAPAPPPAVLAALTASKRTTAETLCALRRLDNVAIRVLAALKAVEGTGLPIAYALALARMEGNLNAPPTSSSLLDHYVPAERSIKFNPDAPPELESDKRGATAFFAQRLMPDISNEVWLANRGHSDFRNFDDAQICEFAAEQGYAVTLIGGDVMATQLFTASVYEEWSAKNWIAAGFAPGRTLPQAKSDAAARWAAIWGLLSARATNGLDGSHPPAVLVAPGDPVAFLAGILKEGVAFMRGLRLTDELLQRPGTFTDEFAYLRYNAAADPSDVPTILLSALIAAQSKNPTLAGRIKDNPDLLAVVTEAATKGESGRAEIANRKRSTVVPRDSMNFAIVNWLQDTENLRLLDEFMQKGTMSAWAHWGEHRRHMWRFGRLLRLYKSAFGTYPG